jgi:NAD+ kinase
MEVIKCVGIVTKPHSPAAIELVPQLLEWLHRRGIEARYDVQTAEYLGRTDGLDRGEVPAGTQLVIVLGGDGTLLSAARAIGGAEIPLFAVNLGSLGFLTAIAVEEVFPELERALRGEHRIGLRRMLECSIMRGSKHVATYDALNDVVLTKAAIARVIDLDAYVDDRFVCGYKADGLIISTPTGSTAYSLSAGGPIIYPSVAALAITPICPHMLTNRPVIVSDTSEIRIVARGDDDSIYLTVDGQVGQPLKQQDRVICRSSSKSIHLIRPPKATFFDVLRAKLKWGER